MIREENTLLPGGIVRIVELGEMVSVTSSHPGTIGGGGLLSFTEEFIGLIKTGLGGLERYGVF